MTTGVGGREGTDTSPRLVNKPGHCSKVFIITKTSTNQLSVWPSLRIISQAYYMSVFIVAMELLCSVASIGFVVTRNVIFW